MELARATGSSGVKVDDEQSNAKGTKIQLTFDQTVTITESFYPGISPTKIFSDLGGSLGLWLGVGAIQLCLSAHQYLALIRRNLMK